MKNIIKNGILLLLITITIYGCSKSQIQSLRMLVLIVLHGQGGSMAKFAISDNHLFLINDSALLVYSVENAENPIKLVN